MYKVSAENSYHKVTVIILYKPSILAFLLYFWNNLLSMFYRINLWFIFFRVFMLGVIFLLSLGSCDFDIIIPFNNMRFGSVWVYLIFLSVKRTWEGKNELLKKWTIAWAYSPQNFLQVIVTNLFWRTNSLPSLNIKDAFDQKEAELLG